VGAVESLVYPWLFFALKGDAATAIGAWLALKTIGNWKGWDEAPGDAHRGHRRLYAFMLANAFQVASGMAVGAAMNLVK
jgi:hypothetical protein